MDSLDRTIDSMFGPQPETDSLDNALDSALGPEPNPRRNLVEAQNYDPNRYAELLKLEQNTGLPAAYIDTHFDHVKQSTEVGRVNFDKLTETPNLQEFLSDPSSARLVPEADEIERLSLLERYSQHLYQSDLIGDYTQKLADLTYANLMGRSTPGEVLEIERLESTISELEQTLPPLTGNQALDWVLGIPSGVEKTLPLMLDITKDAIPYAGAGFGIGFAAGLPTAAVAGPASPLFFGTAGAGAGFGAGVVVEAAKAESGLLWREIQQIELEDGQRVDPRLGKALALFGGTINGLIERLALGVVLRHLPGGQALATGFMNRWINSVLGDPAKRGIFGSLIQGAAEGGIVEGSEEFLQEGVGIFMRQMGVLSAGGSFEDYELTLADGQQLSGVDAMFAQMLQSFSAGAQAGVGLGAGTGGAGGTLRAVGRGIDHVRAEHNLRKLTEAVRLASESTLRERVPERFADFVARNSEFAETDDKVYIPAKEFVEYFQGSDTDLEALEKLIPGVISQIPEASSISGDLVISLADYLTYVGPEHHEGLSQHIRAGATGQTVAESRAQAPDLARLLADEYLEQEHVREEQTEIEITGDEIFEGIVEKLSEAQEPAFAVRSQAALARAAFIAQAKSLELRGKADQIPELARVFTTALEIKAVDVIERKGRGARTFTEAASIGSNTKRATDQPGRFRVGNMAATVSLEEARVLESVAVPAIGVSELLDDAIPIAQSLVSRNRSGVFSAIDRLLKAVKSSLEQEGLPASEIQSQLGSIEQNLRARVGRFVRRRRLTAEPAAFSFEQASRAGLKAAVRVPTGQVFTGFTHGSAFNKAIDAFFQQQLEQEPTVENVEQGFADEAGEFLTRDEAAERAGLAVEGPLRSEELGALRTFNQEPLSEIVSTTPLVSEQRVSDADRLAFKHPRSKDGKYKGAPEWVGSSPQQLAALRKLIQKLVQEGADARFWYERSAREVLTAVNNDFVLAEKFLELLAIYSPQTDVFGNTIFAVRAWTLWRNGVSKEDFHVSTGNRDANAISVLYDDRPWAGRKTNSFYLNLMHALVTLASPEQLASMKLDPDLLKQVRSPVTSDIWVFRGFGYRTDAAAGDLGTGRYSFTENELNRIAAQLNQSKNGEDRAWLAHQVQAALWTAIKARFELPEVQKATYEESVRRGFSHYETKDGKRVWVKDNAAGHLEVWRKHALRASPEAVASGVERAGRSFADALNRMTTNVTWEALPSPTLAHPILHASPELQQRFTDEAREIALADDGTDFIAEQLGVHLVWVDRGTGGYDNAISPNIVTHILPNKPRGDFSRQEADAYARILQFIYKQDAVPWFRADKTTRFKGDFAVVRPDGRAARRFDTQAEAQRYLDDQVAKGKEGLRIQGGKLGRGVAYRFQHPLSPQQQRVFFDALRERLGDDVGWTQTNPHEIVVINFRGEDGVPFLTDDVNFLDQLADLEAEHATSLGIEGFGQFGADAEYGYVHDWEADPEGQGILDQVSVAGRSDLLAWARDRRELFEGLLERYRDTEALEAAAQEQHQRFHQSERGVVAEPDSESAQIDQPALEQRTFQEREQGPIRAAIDIAPDLSAVLLRLSEARDLSSFAHELGHLYFETLRRFGDPKDLQIIRSWLGLQAGERITGEHHEKFARAWELYLFEGKSPSQEMVGVFARFRIWLMQVYEDIQRYAGVQLTEEVRGVFDRLIASDEAIQQARQAQGFFPAFEDAESAGMTEAEFDDYRRAHDLAVEASRNPLDRELLKEQIRDLRIEAAEAEREIRERVTAEVNQRPIYQVRHWLQRGELLDRETPEALKHVRLDRQMLIDNYGGLEGLPFGRHGVWQKDGVSPEVIADLFGFKSGQELVDKLRNLKSREQAIDEAVDVELKRQFGDILNDGTLTKRALEASINNPQGQFILREQRALARRFGAGPVPIQVAREAAKRIIGGKVIGELRPDIYRSAEARMAREALEAIARKDWGAANDAKRKQLLNHYLALEAQKARDRSNRNRDYANRLTKPAAQKRVGKAQGGYLERMNEQLERFNLKKISMRRAEIQQAFADWITEHENDGDHFVIDEQLRKDSFKKNWKLLTVDEFQNVIDMIRSIEYASIAKNKLLADKDKREFDAVKDMLVREIRARNPSLPERVNYSPNWLQKRYDSIDAAYSYHWRPEFFFEFLDAEESLGPVWTAMFQPIADAEARELAEFEKMAERIQQLFGNLSRDERAAWYSTRVHVPELGVRLTREEIISFLLNLGNEYNRSALMEGGVGRGPLNDAQVQAVMDIATRQEWELVQGIWDYIAEFKDEAFALERELTGVTPESVESTPVVTRYGTFNGGYYPLKAKSTGKRTLTAYYRESLSDVKALFESSWTRPMTRHGHLNDRKGWGGQQVNLSLSVFSEHLHNVIHDITHRKAIIQVHRLTNHPEIAAAIEDVAGTEAYRRIRPWLKEIAGDQINVNFFAEKLLGKARSGATIVFMGYKMTVIMSQFAGLFNSAEFVGARPLARTLLNLFSQPHLLNERRKFILNRSQVMRSRMKSYDREVRDTLKKAARNAEGFQHIARASERAKVSYFLFTGMADWFVSGATWLTRYEQGLEMFGKDEEAAIRLADQAVRLSQGSGAVKDLPGVQRGPEAFRMFVMMYGYFSVALNQQLRVLRRYRRGRVNESQVIASAIFLVVGPALVAEILAGRGPEEDEEWLKWIAKEIPRYLGSGVVIAREMVNHIISGIEGKSFDYRLTPAQEFFATPATAVAQLFQDVAEGELRRSTVRKGFETLGFYAQFPARQIWIDAEALYDIHTGQGEVEIPRDFAFPRPPERRAR